MPALIFSRANSAQLLYGSACHSELICKDAFRADLALFNDGLHLSNLKQRFIWVTQRLSLHILAHRSITIMPALRQFWVKVVGHKNRIQDTLFVSKKPKEQKK